MILLIDNYDSFSYNLYQLIETLGSRVEVFYNDRISVEDIRRLAPEKIVISPGPRTPEYAGVCVPAIRAFYKTVPILGVCLGHQCIGVAFGSRVVSASRTIHGQAVDIFHEPSALFSGLPSPFQAARYHSLVIDSIPSGFRQTARDADDDIMAMEHDSYPLFGIQFHPESFMTREGEHIIRKFLHESD